MLIRLPLFTLFVLLAATSLQARTESQDAAVDLFWQLTEQCRAGIREDGQCEAATRIQEDLKLEGLCFVWGEGDGFFPCENVTPTEQAGPSVGFRGSVFTPVFNLLSLEKRKALQRNLADAGLYGDAIDGISGRATARAVRLMAERIEIEDRVDLDMRDADGARDVIERILARD